jgi:ethanolamine utilization protein EutQ
LKKLICASEVKTAAESGKKIVSIDSNTIVTAAANDLARELGVEFAVGSVQEPSRDIPAKEIDRDMIYQVVKAVLANSMMASVATPQEPFHADRDPSGLKIVRGRTVTLENFDTGIPSNNVGYREVVSKEESQMSSGFLTLEKSSFDWELCYEEIDIVLEGSLSITINGETYQAYQGDVLFVPKGSKVTWSAAEYVKLFYVTYPANWADLMAEK